jgi:Pyrimidine dimer DNA glycosylase
MQTFFTWPQYGRIARDLDNPRLGKQMTECMQIFDHLTGVTPNFYPNHPVMGMWRGYEFALGIYAMMLNLEWTHARGFACHKALRFFYESIREMQQDDDEFTYEAPPWIRDPAVLLSHRSNLTRKNKDRYGKMWKNNPNNWPYIWPQIDFDHEDGYTLWVSKSDKLRLKKGEREWPDDETCDRIMNL